MKQLFLMLLLVSVSLLAQEVKDEWKFGGQLQLRTELDGRDFSNKTFAPVFTTMRTRFDATKKFSEVAEFFIQFQDSRIFGTEASTSSNEKNVDLRQGYVKLHNPFGLPVSVQAGRFEMVYGTERFFGAVGWNYIGRSFDGARFMFGNENNKLHLFAITATQSGGIVTAATPASYKYPEDADKGASVYGLWYKPTWNEGNTLEFLVYWDNYRNMSNGKDKDVDRFTFSGTHWGKYGSLSTITEAAYQTGKVGAKTQAAYLFSFNGYYAFNELIAGLGADLLSGNKVTDTDKSNCFDTRYGTGHKFFGYMDYFTSFPAHTGNLGINDFHLTMAYNPKESKYSAHLAVHNFSSAQKNAADLSSFGNEVDVTLKYQFAKPLAVTFGQSVFMPGDLMKANFKLAALAREDMAFWSYIMIQAMF